MLFFYVLTLISIAICMETNQPKECRVNDDCGAASLCDRTLERPVCVDQRSKRNNDSCLSDSYCKSHICDKSTTPTVCIAALEKDVNESCSDSNHCKSLLCDMSQSQPTCINFFSKKTGETCVSDVYCASNACDRSQTPPRCVDTQNKVKHVNETCGDRMLCQRNLICDVTSTAMRGPRSRLNKQSKCIPLSSKSLNEPCMSNEYCRSGLCDTTRYINEPGYCIEVRSKSVGKPCKSHLYCKTGFCDTKHHTPPQCDHENIFAAIFSKIAGNAS